MMFRQLTRIHSSMKGAVSPQILCSRSISSSDRPILTLYTKENCSLCDDAKEVLQDFPNQFTLEEVDITTPDNKHWYKQYRYEIPVFHFQGQFLMKHRVDIKLLTQKLEEYYSAMK